MSADNGVYILSTISDWKKDREGVYSKREVPIRVYRIAHASAIDNFDWYRRNQPYNLGWYMDIVWGKSVVYEKQEEAVLAAHALARTIEFLEYGVTSIDTEFTFPGNLE
jgi:hypothetical protein